MSIACMYSKVSITLDISRPFGKVSIKDICPSLRFFFFFSTPKSVGKAGWIFFKPQFEELRSLAYSHIDPADVACFPDECSPSEPFPDYRAVCLADRAGALWLAQADGVGAALFSFLMANSSIEFKEVSGYLWLLKLPELNCSVTGIFCHLSILCVAL